MKKKLLISKDATSSPFRSSLEIDSGLIRQHGYLNISQINIPGDQLVPEKSKNNITVFDGNIEKSNDENRSKENNGSLMY